MRNVIPYLILLLLFCNIVQALPTGGAQQATLDPNAKLVMSDGIIDANLQKVVEQIRDREKLGMLIIDEVTEESIKFKAIQKEYLFGLFPMERQIKYEAYKTGGVKRLTSKFLWSTKSLWRTER